MKWCVCGQTNGNEPWEAVETGLKDEDTAIDWLKENFARFPNYSAFYVDREENDGYAAYYYDARNGELVLTNQN